MTQHRRTYHTRPRQVEAVFLHPNTRGDNPNAQSLAEAVELVSESEGNYAQYYYEEEVPGLIVNDVWARAGDIVYVDDRGVARVATESEFFDVYEERSLLIWPFI